MGETKAKKAPLGVQLRQLRESANLSQHDLARRADVPAATISRIETGQVPNPRQDTLLRLASALTVSVSELTGDMVVERLEDVAAMRNLSRVFAALTEGMTTDEAQEILTMYLELDEEDRADILKLMKRLAEKG